MEGQNNIGKNYFFCLPVDDRSKSIVLDGVSFLMAQVWLFKTTEELQEYKSATEKYIAQIPGYRILLSFHQYLDIPASEANPEFVKRNLQVLADVYLKYKIQPNENSYNRYRTNTVG